MMLRLVQKTPAWVLWAFVILMTLLGVVGFVDANSDNREQDTRISRQSDALGAQDEQIESLEAAVAEANQLLAAVGVPPVPVPTTENPPSVPPVVIREPSPAEIDAAVRRYCSSGVCRGRGVTKAQVRSALAVYCSSGACEGDPGTDGTSGTPGSAGPGPTDAQVASALADYCGSSSGACRGRGIAALACAAGLPHGLTIRVTYTDGTTDTVTCSTTTGAKGR